MEASCKFSVVSVEGLVLHPCAHLPGEASPSQWEKYFLVESPKEQGMG